MSIGSDEIRAILSAYREVKDASWPSMHPAMLARAPLWPATSLAELQAELAGYVAEASLPSCRVRVFWKLGPQFKFNGCNEHFARDAGLATAELMGLDDFEQRLPWQAQAAKYRADEVLDKETGTRLYIERSRR